MTSECDDDYNRSDAEDSHLKESMLPHPEVMRKLRKYRAKYRHYKSIYMDSEEGGWEYEGYVVTSEGDDEEEQWYNSLIHIFSINFFIFFYNNYV